MVSLVFWVPVGGPFGIVGSTFGLLCGRGHLRSGWSIIVPAMNAFGEEAKTLLRKTFR